MDPKEPRTLLAEIRSTRLTQCEVAQELGLSQSTVSKLERGKTGDVRLSVFKGLLEMHQRVVKHAKKKPRLSQNRAKASAKSFRKDA